MLFDLRDVFLSHGAEKDTVFHLDLSDATVGSEHPFTSDIIVSAHAQNKTGMVTLTLKTDFDYATVCARCLTPLHQTLSFRFSHRLIEELEEEFNDDYIETPEFTVDLEQLATSDIFLSLPSKFLCKRDCQGLCEKCGQNLNLGDCDCEKNEIDPRLEKLKELLND